jgi:hypothetical protein
MFVAYGFPNEWNKVDEEGGGGDVKTFRPEFPSFLCKQNSWLLSAKPEKEKWKFIFKFFISSNFLGSN